MLWLVSVLALTLLLGVLLVLGLMGVAHLDCSQERSDTLAAIWLEEGRVRLRG